MLNHTVGSLTTFRGERVSIEVDMRSGEKDGRTVHVFADKKQSSLFFYGLPECVKFGILFIQPASIEFESLEELRESSVREMEGGYGYRFEGEKLMEGEEDVPLIKQLGLPESAA